MKWRKAPEELKELFAETTRSLQCERRFMFGYPALFAGGRMFAGLFEDRLFVRLPQARVAELAVRHGAFPHLEPMPGRPMKDYVVLPETLVRDPSLLPGMLQEALVHARSLPPKPKGTGGRARRG